MEDNTFYLLTFFVLFIGSLLTIFFIIDSQDINEVEVKCYDRSYNEIIGVSCMEEQYSYFGQGYNHNTEELFVVLIFMLTILFSVSGVGIMVIGILLLLSGVAWVYKDYLNKKSGGE